MDESVRSRFLGVGNSPAMGMFVLLLTIDVVLIVFYVTQVLFGRPGGFLFDLGADRGYGEFVQYQKSLWTAMLLLWLALRRRAFVYVAWALVALYLLADDALHLHEHAGWAFRDGVPGGPGWAVHVGELVYLAAVGLVLVTLVVIGHVRAGREDRTVSAALTALFALLVLVGVGLDAVHHLLFPGPQLRSLFTLFEDGGELIVLTFITALVFAVALCRHHPRLPRWLGFLVGRREGRPRVAQGPEAPRDQAS